MDGNKGMREEIREWRETSFMHVHFHRRVPSAYVALSGLEDDVQKTDAVDVSGTAPLFSRNSAYSAYRWT